MELYKYEKTGNLYEVIAEGRMKNPDTLAWVDCVFYKSVNDGHVYAREKKDFYEKFSKTSDL